MEALSAFPGCYLEEITLTVLILSNSVTLSGHPFKKRNLWDFPGDAVVKNPPANAGDTGSIPGPGRSHMLWSN